MYTVRMTRVPDNGVLTQEKLPLKLGELLLGSPFDPDGVSVSWELTRLMGKVYGKVHAQGGVTLECGRCLGDFKSEVRTYFSVMFEPRPRASARGGGVAEGKDEEDEEDAGPSVVYFDGEELPLGEEIRQELEMAVPFTPLCKGDCRGLCPACGKNLNEGPCACV